MTLSAAVRLRLYAGFAATTFLLAIVLGRAELAALGAPFALYLLIALVILERPSFSLRLVVETERSVEGAEIGAALEVTATASLPELEVIQLLPPGVELSSGDRRHVLTLRNGEERQMSQRLVLSHWGAYRVGASFVRVRDRFGLFTYDARVAGTASIRVYPAPERLQSLLLALETQPFAGNRVARTKGEGIEFADIRPFVAGDHVRRINWRTSARRQALYVNEAHPERNSDVVLLLDSFASAPRGSETTFDLALRAAATLAREYLGQRDRVGVVSFGGVVRWLEPSLGTTQLYRIADALIESEVSLSFAWKGIEVLPRRSLPPQALVIALTPLLDERGVRALLDLRARGFDLAVVEVSPLSVMRSATGDDARALRLWRLWREALRFRYERLGVAVVEWREGEPLMQSIEEVQAFRRYARGVYA